MAAAPFVEVKEIGRCRLAARCRSAPVVSWLDMVVFRAGFNSILREHRPTFWRERRPELTRNIKKSAATCLASVEQTFLTAIGSSTVVFKTQRHLAEYSSISAFWTS